MLNCLLLVAVAGTDVVGAQGADYMAQCSNRITVPYPQNNPGLVQDCAALLAYQ